MLTIETLRLLLRPYSPEDLESFIRMNKNTKVAEFLPHLLTTEESEAFTKSIQDHFLKQGYGLYSCVLKEFLRYMGYVGLNKPTFKAHFMPCIEIGWRLLPEYWEKGYATEAAQAVLKAGFTLFKLSEIVAFTVSKNTRSINVMEKLGMHQNPNEDFHHPRLALDHPLSLYVLYRLKQDDFLKISADKQI